MKHKINLCIFNAEQRGVLDQIWVAKEIFVQHGYDFMCTTTLRPDCLNLLIENFVEEDAGLLETFSRQFGKRVAIMMTEHIERETEGFTIGGAPLQDSVYITNKAQRLFSLLSMGEVVFGYFTFGELPELRTWNEMVPSHRPYRLPWPSIRGVAQSSTPRDYDIVFTGSMTPYREVILGDLGRKYRIVRSDITETEEERAELYARAKVAVTIPQTKDWKWVSPMRVLFGLRAGVPTVDLGKDRSTRFGRAIVPPVDIERAIADHERLFPQQLKSYEDFIGSPDNGAFPSGIFDLWAELEFPV